MRLRKKKRDCSLRGLACLPCLPQAGLAWGVGYQFRRWVKGLRRVGDAEDAAEGVAGDEEFFVGGDDEGVEFGVVGGDA